MDRFDRKRLSLFHYDKRRIAASQKAKNFNEVYLPPLYPEGGFERIEKTGIAAIIPQAPGPANGPAGHVAPVPVVFRPPAI